ncbi:hypothetical protein [Streptomyces lydicus]|uniref:hypothetical protein n=1 Tax=Streptomyces lydicus TaxID=47763 RepID=UPI00379E0DEF
MTYEYTDPTGDRVDIESVRLNTPNGTITAIAVRPEGSSFYIAADQADEFFKGVRGVTGKATGTELTTTERDMLRYALDLAQEKIYSRGDEFTDDDQNAVDSLRRLLDLAQPTP